MDSVFDEFFRDPFFENGIGSMFGFSHSMREMRDKVKPVKVKKKKDPMADMYDWSKPVFPGKRGYFDDEDYDFSYESDGKCIVFLKKNSPKV